MLSMLNDIRDSGTYMSDRLAHDSRVLVYDYIKVAQRQHGGSFFRFIWNLGITWVCNSTIEDEEANVGLLGFTPMVFQFSFFKEQFPKELTEIVQYLIVLLTSCYQEVSCVGIQ